MMRKPSRRNPGRVRIARAVRAARKAEGRVASYEFSGYLSERIRLVNPTLDKDGRGLIVQGLREWFICCAWRGGMVLGMPSRAVDRAWHEFILDSSSYFAFSYWVFGNYLHHVPDEAATGGVGSV